MIVTVRRGALTALTALTLAIPSAAHAETASPVPPADSTGPATVAAGPTVAGPTVAAAAVALQPRHAAAESATVMQPRAGLGKPRALMFVGLGMFLAGALIGHDVGTVIMIGGAGVGLYGLYQYLQ